MIRAVTLKIDKKIVSLLKALTYPEGKVVGEVLVDDGECSENVAGGNTLGHLQRPLWPRESGGYVVHIFHLHHYRTCSWGVGREFMDEF